MNATHGLSESWRPASGENSGIFGVRGSQNVGSSSSSGQASSVVDGGDAWIGMEDTDWAEWDKYFPIEQNTGEHDNTDWIARSQSETPQLSAVQTSTTARSTSNVSSEQALMEMILGGIRPFSSGADDLYRQDRVS
jgi:hypothetical protein